MKTIYLDSDFKCHLENDGTMREFEVEFFDGMCDEYIEGYRFVPDGETWARSDGEVFSGAMVSPWKDWRNLDSIQGKYERAQYHPLRTENETLLNDMAQMIEEVYASDMEMMGL